MIGVHLIFHLVVSESLHGIVPGKPIVRTTSAILNKLPLALAMLSSMAFPLQGADNAPETRRTLSPEEARQAYESAVERTNGTVCYSYPWERRHKHGVEAGREYVMEHPKGNGRRWAWLREEGIVRDTTKKGYVYELPTLTIVNETGRWVVLGRIAIKSPGGSKKKILDAVNRSIGGITEEKRTELLRTAAQMDEAMKRKLEAEKQAYEDIYSGEEFERDGRTLWRLIRHTNPLKIEMIERTYQSIIDGDVVVREADALFEGAPKTMVTKKMAKAALKNLPMMRVREEIVIDPADQMVLEEREFASDGKMLEETIRNNVRHEVLDEVFFMLPKDCEQWEPKSLWEYGWKYGEAHGRQRKEYREAQRQAKKENSEGSSETAQQVEGSTNHPSQPEQRALQGDVSEEEEEEEQSDP